MDSGLVISTFSKIFVDNILVGQMYGWAKPLLVGMVVTAVLRGITYSSSTICCALKQGWLYPECSRFFRHGVLFAGQFFFQRHALKRVNRVTLNDTVARLLSGDLAANMVNGVMIVFYAFLCFNTTCSYSIGVAVAVLNMLFLRYVSRKRVDLNQKLQQEQGKLIGGLNGRAPDDQRAKATGAKMTSFLIVRLSGQSERSAGVRVTNNLLTSVPRFSRPLTAQLSDWRRFTGHERPFEHGRAGRLSKFNGRLYYPNQ